MDEQTKFLIEVNDIRRRAGLRQYSDDEIQVMALLEAITERPETVEQAEKQIQAAMRALQLARKLPLDQAAAHEERIQDNLNQLRAIKQELERLAKRHPQLHGKPKPEPEPEPEPELDDEDGELSTAEIYHILKTAMPSVGFLSRDKRVKAFWSVAAAAQNLINDGRADPKNAGSALILLYNNHKPFLKAAVMTTGMAPRYGVADIPVTDDGSMIDIGLHFIQAIADKEGYPGFRFMN